MPYTADISRANPSCFMFLVDQSYSMEGALAGQAGQHKMDAAADTINRVLESLTLRCSQGMDVRDYFDIGILGYGYEQKVEYDPNQVYGYLDANEVYHEIPHAQLDKDNLVECVVISVLPGTTLEQPFLPISRVVEVAEMVDRQVRESDGSGGTTEVTRKIPVWLRPHAGAQTPMCEALAHAGQAIERWISQHPDSFPPAVINISDGEANDGDPEPVAQQIMELQTSDGNVLMYNCHLSELAAMPIQYPDQESGLPDGYARQLFRMSSVMPQGIRNQATLLDTPVNEQSRCYVYNADMVSLAMFLDIGTRGPSNLH